MSVVAVSLKKTNKSYSGNITLSLGSATVLDNVLAAVREFLSTLSLRRATLELKPISNFGLISIHALLAESDIFTLNL